MDGWRLRWRFGSAEVQSLGGMLGPVDFDLADGRRLQPFQLAPWAGTQEAAALPGILRRLRGEWPCVPFGRTDCPPGLPAGWTARDADDAWPHGYGANHAWNCVEARPDRLHLAIDYPDDAAVVRLERVLQADPDAPALDVTLTIRVRTRICMPLALHPTFRMPAMPGRLILRPAHYDAAVSYPVTAEAGVSRLRPDTVSTDLAALPAKQGRLDLSSLPLPFLTEELLQLKGIRAAADQAPFILHYLDENVRLGLWWDTLALPDVMLWVSNGGRATAPWSQRHFALGVEPLNGVFDLARTARPPPQHLLAERQGIVLTPERAWTTRYRIAAW